MKLSNHLDAQGYRLKSVADPVADSDALNAMAITPNTIGDGKTFRVPDGKQVLFAMPIDFTGSGAIEFTGSGALVEVA